MQGILSKATTNMTTGKEWKVIVGFAIPIFLSNLFQQMYNSVDSIIVGKYIGTNALGAVSSSGNLIFLFTSFFIGATNGAGVVIAKYFGEKRYDDMRKAIHTDIAFGTGKLCPGCCQSRFIRIGSGNAALRLQPAPVCCV